MLLTEEEVEPQSTDFYSGAIYWTSFSWKQERNLCNNCTPSQTICHSYMVFETVKMT